MATEAPEVTIQPEWAAWRAALGGIRHSEARAELGLDTQRPILFSGHQPIVFHNGILAKLIAQHVAAQQCGAERVWIVADQDPVNLAEIRLPIGSGATLHARTISLCAPEEFPEEVPPASMPAIKIPDSDDSRLAELIVYLNRVQEYTGQQQQGPTLAEQFAHGTIRYACDRLGIPVPRLLFASELFRSDTLWGVVERMLLDPRSCVHAYNEAVERYPDARVRALELTESRVELPMWASVR